MKLISIVVPCHNEEGSLPTFYEEINAVSKTMKSVEFEFIFVNDGSKDKTLEILKDFAKKDSRVHYISFSRNFFKEAAMLAGFEHAKGDYIGVMDADLQDPPSYLPEMLKGIREEGYDCVATKSVSRKGYSFIRKTGTKLFYGFIAKLSKSEMVHGARDYRLMTRQMMDAILSMKEYNRYSKGLFGFVGFEIKWIEYINPNRLAGESDFDLITCIKYALEGIIAFSTAPLVMAAFIGVLFCFIAFILMFVIIFKTLIWGDPVGGWPSLACIIFFVGGIQLFCTGIIGAYLSKTYLETKRRPLYFIKETNCKENNINEK